MGVGHRTDAKFWYLELRFHCGGWNRFNSVFSRVILIAPSHTLELES